ncbi:hypothetical protein ES288_D13G134400v1 [Gossypium darwinii]|uniref:Uncharacterized protein n=1 Tax=Gossypium darwinii TaxID=34276 RepID=A0A5D1ZXP0_GOSDA|nr:hypothetical protein ES288_D13G134400v1 [Gossypium darwinii]
MQALWPRRLKAASKLIFTNSGFDGCQLFNSIRLTVCYRISRSSLTLMNPLMSFCSNSTKNTCKKSTLCIGVMLKKLGNPLRAILHDMGIGFNFTCTSRTKSRISHSSIVYNT